MVEKVLFFFSAIGVFNAFLIGNYLFFVGAKKSMKTSFYALLLQLLVIRVGVSSFHFFETVPQGAIKLGLIANFLLGPTMLFLMETSINSNKKIEHQRMLHFGFCTLLLIPMWFVFNFATWNWIIRYILHFGLMIYLGYIAFKWRGLILLFFQHGSHPVKSKRAVITYLALVTICIGFTVALFTSYIVGPLVFSIIFYLVTSYFLTMNGKERPQSIYKGINRSEYSRLNQRLTELMNKEKLYRNPDISLESLAVRLSISRHLLSQLLNDHLNNSFYKYINSYRIEDACLMLRDNKSFSVEAVGYEVGFNSRSSFFSSFKKLKGTTPSKFREEFESV